MIFDREYIYLNLYDTLNDWWSCWILELLVIIIFKYIHCLSQEWSTAILMEIPLCVKQNFLFDVLKSKFCNVPWYWFVSCSNFPLLYIFAYLFFLWTHMLENFQPGDPCWFHDNKVRYRSFDDAKRHDRKLSRKRLSFCPRRSHTHNSNAPFISEYVDLFFVNFEHVWTA